MMTPSATASAAPILAYLPLGASENAQRAAFLTYYRADQTAASSLGAVMVLQPFLDELNKSRRALSLAARALAQSGVSVLIVDVPGTGDASGEHAELTVQSCLNDWRAALAWLAEREPGVPLGLWAIRSSALLLDAFTATLPSHLQPRHCLLWNPVLQGKTYVNQWVRLLTAGQLTRSDAAALNLTADEVYARWQAGLPVEVGGYDLSAGLIEGDGECGLKHCRLALPVARPKQLHKLAWIEHDASASISPAVKRALVTAESQGWRVSCVAQPGPNYWAAMVTEPCPELVASTVAMVGNAEFWN